MNSIASRLLLYSLGTCKGYFDVIIYLDCKVIHTSSQIIRYHHSRLDITTRVFDLKVKGVTPNSRVFEEHIACKTLLLYNKYMIRFCSCVIQLFASLCLLKVV